MRKHTRQKGFTLVELMVVVVIAMVLAGIAVPVYMHYIQEGKKSEAYAVIDSAVSGAKIYFQRYNTYVGGSFVKFKSGDDVGNATYFTYALGTLSTKGFTVTATLSGDWGPKNAKIIWTQAGADGASGDVGTGSFSETGW